MSSSLAKRWSADDPEERRLQNANEEVRVDHAVGARGGGRQAVDCGGVDQGVVVAHLLRARLPGLLDDFDVVLGDVHARLFDDCTNGLTNGIARNGGARNAVDRDAQVFEDRRDRALGGGAFIPLIDTQLRGASTAVYNLTELVQPARTMEFRMLKRRQNSQLAVKCGFQLLKAALKKG